MESQSTTDGILELTARADPSEYISRSDSASQSHYIIRQSSEQRKAALNFVEWLPVELAWRCIMETLPLNENYSSQLLALTLVSQNWQKLLLDASIFWTQIYIEWSQPNLFAILTLFLELSGKRTLDITIWYHPDADWERLRGIFEPHRDRIVAMLVNKPQTTYRAPKWTPQVQSEHYILTVLTILRTFSPLPQLRQLAFDRTLTLNSPQIESLALSGETEIISNIELYLEPAVSESDALLRSVTNVTLLDPLEIAVPLTFSFLSLSNLVLGGEDSKEATARSRDPSVSKCNLAHLRSLIYRQKYSSTVEGLVRMTSTHLSHLHLWISSKLAEIVDLLRVVIHLRTLTLDISRSEGDILDISESDVKIHSLTALTLRTHDTVGVLSSAYGRLINFFRAVRALYPDVKSVSIAGFSTIITLATDFFTSLRSVESLSLRNLQNTLRNQSIITLLALCELSVDNLMVLKNFDVPNLLNLDVSKVESGTQLAGLTSHRLRRLSIDAFASSGIISIDSQEYPELCELHLNLRGPKDIWRLPSLLQLITITLTSKTFMNPQGNLLCVQLIYHPEYCPSLQNIHFDDFLEWDILFLMLRRRNYGGLHVAKITRVAIPYIPLRLREPLDRLLEGEPVVESDLPLSLEETREVIVERTVQGCIYCLKNMRAGCDVQVQRRQRSGAAHPGVMFAKYPDPPASVPREVVSWLTSHRLAVERWKMSLLKFEIRESRIRRCHRYLEEI